MLSVTDGERVKEAALKKIKAWAASYFAQKVKGWSIFLGLSYTNVKLRQVNMFDKVVILTSTTYANKVT